MLPLRTMWRPTNLMRCSKVSNPFSGSRARVIAALWCYVAFGMGTVDATADTLRTVHSDGLPQNIVLGFVGGFVRHDDLHHAEVQLAEHLRKAYAEGVTVRVFENWHRGEAHRA